MAFFPTMRRFLVGTVSTYFAHIDPAWQKLQLRGYTSNIKEVADGTIQSDNGIYCIFVYYETDGKVSRSVQNILKALKRQDVNTIVVTNATLSDEQINFLSEYSHSIIRRGNQGFDFGAYKDCIAHIQKTADDVKRLILLNDSVYYFSSGIDDFVENLLSQEDSVAAFENWDPIHAYHLQSFALSVSADVFRHPNFVSFWDEYIPVNNRLHAIEHGEKKLSDACLASSASTKVVYNTDDAINASLKASQELEPFEFSISSPLDIRSDKSFIFSDNVLAGRTNSISKEIESLKFLSNIEGIYRGSPIHAGMMFFIWYTSCPMVKKDIVFREQFRFWEVEYILRKRFDVHEVEEFLTMVRKKRTLKNLPIVKRFKTKIGAA